MDNVSRHVGYTDAMERSGRSPVTAQGTMHHLAFDVPLQRMDEYVDRLRAKGVAVTNVVNHSNSRNGGHKPDWDPETDEDDVFVRSLYFKDPNGIVLEFASWVVTFDESDVAHAPKTANELRSAAAAAPAR